MGNMYIYQRQDKTTELRIGIGEETAAFLVVFWMRMQRLRKEFKMFGLKLQFKDDEY